MKPAQTGTGTQREKVQFLITVFAVTAAAKRNLKLRQGIGKLLPAFNCCLVEKHELQLKYRSQVTGHNKQILVNLW